MSEREKDAFEDRDLCRALYRGGPVHEIGATVRCGRPFGHEGDHKGAVSGGGRAEWLRRHNR